MLDVTDVFQVNSLVRSVFTTVACFLTLAICIVVIFAKDSEFGDVSKTLVHPAASAPVIVSVAIKQLLNRILLKLIVDSCK